MKNKKLYTIAALTGVGLLLAASLASAAVDKVRCIVWQGDPAKYHTALSGQSAQLKAVITTDSTATVWYKWVYGDGTESTVTALSGATQYKVATTHTYTGAAETPFTAQLQVDSVDNTMANAVSDNYLVKLQDSSLDSRVNIAIDKGLWWLYTNNYTDSYLHTFDGSPFMAWNQTSYSSTWASPTASAVQAFAINNHKTTGNINEDPYVEAVQLGMNWLVQGYYYTTSYPMLQTVSIGLQHGVDDPEEGQAAPNGVGIQVRSYTYYPIYEGGQVMDAIISSGVQPGDSTNRDFTSRGSAWTYGELLQDMVDMYAWGQYDGNSTYGILGGWRYSWNQGPDNSACQWGAIGMSPSQEAPWSCTVPGWVKTYNANWLNYSHQSWYVGTLNVGGFGYTGSGNGYGTSPSGLVQMAFDGQVGYDDPATVGDDRDIKWVRTENYFAYYWSNFLSSNNTYGWYAFAKAMRLAVPQPVERLLYNNLDWYPSLADKIVSLQNSTGYWNGTYTNTPLSTAWMIITLRPALFRAAPVACFNADPNPTYPDAVISFDPACSDHSETGKDISNLVSFEWDWNHDGVYDESTVDPDAVTHSFACASLPCVYPVTLRVTDDSDPDSLSATYTMDIDITNPPHPPSADADGPYMVSLCTADSLTLDGSASFDPNEGTHEAGCATCPDDTITDWGWDLTPPLTGFDDESGEIVTVVPGDYFTAGSHNVGLRVTDNTAAAYPGSGDPNLTDTDFSSVDVSGDCQMCTLSARPKLDKVQLVWTSTGAASYDIYRSTTGPNSGFTLIADDHVTDYATYLDSPVTIGTTYWYRVVDSNNCGSVAVSVVPSLRTR
ncbi:MAG: PKD domain-containing protein [Proteobacteria bacterium]|nr:PKD domain-containing protein [Pseudomonadota bacterium]MBU4297385.1 PKD domain-containing protein [Pseudomonadota bacterium]MCG2748729.1 PKD domain-containing protein [Desulfobulbaceae bacterium]